MIKRKLQELLARFIEPRIITEVVTINEAAEKREDRLRRFSEITTAKYGITLEDLKSDFSPGKFHGKGELMFWEEYRKPGNFDAPYIAWERSHMYTLVGRNEVEKWRNEALLKIKDVSKRFNAALKKIHLEFGKEFE